MTSSTYFFACVLITLAAVAAYVVADLLRRAKLRAVAEQVEMHFCPVDRFNLAADVARRFPVPGVADPKVSDLLYSRRDDRVWYVFRFEYTVGVTGPKLRRRAIVGFIEPRDREGGEATRLIIAEPGPSLEQYRQVLEQLRRENDPAQHVRSEEPTLIAQST